MIPLIDADILLYEIGFGAQYEDTGILNFDIVAERIDRLIDSICRGAGGTSPPELYLTGKGNFREEIAKKKEYKGNRAEVKKPFHYENIKNYLLATYNTTIVDGMEADDMLCIRQMERIAYGDTIICSRDKDLRQCQGWHYSWECGRQPEKEPYYVDELGELELAPKKLEGTGLKFFYAQILMGDPVDNILGLQGYGKVKVYKLLNDATSEKELFERCLYAYEEKYAENASKELLEQARLVWMVKELDEDGNPIMWELSDYER